MEYDSTTTEYLFLLNIYKTCIFDYIRDIYLINSSLPSAAYML